MSFKCGKAAVICRASEKLNALTMFLVGLHSISISVRAVVKCCVAPITVLVTIAGEPRASMPVSSTQTVTMAAGKRRTVSSRNSMRRTRNSIVAVTEPATIPRVAIMRWVYTPSTPIVRRSL